MNEINLVDQVLLRADGDRGHMLTGVIPPHLSGPLRAAGMGAAGAPVLPWAWGRGRPAADVDAPPGRALPIGSAWCPICRIRGTITPDRVSVAVVAAAVPLALFLSALYHGAL